MTFRDCQCEKADCPECGPFLALAKQIRQEFEHTRSQACVPTPEIVWWRAQMRAREEAARKAARPILLTQALAIAALIGLLISIAGRLTFPALSLDGIASLSVGVPVLRVAVAAICFLVLAPIAVYFALARE